MVGRVFGWARSEGSRAISENITATTSEDQEPEGRSLTTWTSWISWIWRGWRRQYNPNNTVEEFWEAQEKFQPVDIQDALISKGAFKQEVNSEPVSRWWTSFLSWPRKTDTNRQGRMKSDGHSSYVWDHDIDGDLSEYGTPPPSPTPSSSPLMSPFRLFVNSWKVEILPEHHEICFNFLRHLFDLFVVGFLWTVSPPAKLILEVLGVQGALRLWLHGMAMFFVSTVGMAGLLWLIQEYLAQFALIYGILQALVISVSVRQSVILGLEEEKGEDSKMTDEMKDKWGLHELVSVKDKMKAS